MLKILSLIYEKLALLRRWLYDTKILKSQKLPVPVISVGNLSVGGTGKTPITIAIARKLQSQGYRVCVLSRGYKRKTKGTIVVSDGKKIFTDWKSSGDEPYLIATYNIPVVVSESRYEAGIKAIELFKPDIFILDDGFQHYQLYRDIDILVVDATKPFWEDQPLPAGRLREPIETYKYADLFVINRFEKVKNKEQFLKKLKAFDKPFFITEEKFQHLTNLKENIPVKDLKGEKIGIFAGLGNNQQFFNTVEDLSKKYNFQVLHKISFPDHYDYPSLELSQNVDKWITTEKDIIKLKPETIKKYNIFALKYELKLPEEMVEFINKKINPKRK
ncbi:tetraacyldisaccharide 4'-kinase [Persephonella sp. KM09-Lau-8]|uniref:tetraacyldisaccharide 4'-kinase n=1 Tax=Persephonella sp. KM09-Lau-8 TaxID=1158345 RepID=UPI0004963487|nr:tetraacyldisaccharide 4'-kinase [Persephonella sp. KM09-Lau-8]